MGRLFAEHRGGAFIYNCRKCGVFLTNKENLISTRFQGASGKAYLFKKVWNIKEEEACIRDMLTGRHLVRDVSCLFCNAKLGWMYEIAYMEDQRYKEGAVILEKAHFKEEEGIDEAVPDPKEPPSCVRSARPTQRGTNYLGISYARQHKAIVRLCGIPPEYDGETRWKDEEEMEEVEEEEKEILELIRPKTKKERREKRRETKEKRNGHIQSLSTSIS
ncbi:hypothetical protein PENTCL1PPCAC_17888 [Pristionchus entomophagus]|uniref:Yippee domain-containing protein n=1 Tax=Pristionchus entomophagus TaxID=358040 RepID=A0AAV5TMR5_9BILA|nr:hypothetical protein PENTCL1PPCAC_17888 [Pristionchus entomophagus]